MEVSNSKFKRNQDHNPGYGKEGNSGEEKECLSEHRKKMAAAALHDVVQLRPLHSLQQRKDRGPGFRGKLAFPQIYSNKPPILGLGYGNRSFITCYRDQSIESGGSVLGVSEIKEKCSKWQWKGQYSINYFVSSSNAESNPPLLLVRGFGASIPHWRRNFGTLAQDYTVYAIDLLGFGASDKPQGFSCTMEAWAQSKPGSRACAGEMNNKAIVDDWRIKLLLPLLWLFDFLLKQRGIAAAVFERAKQRDNLRNILLSVYGNKESVDDELVEIIDGPANEEGALDAFVLIITGPPGPNAVQLMPRINLPVLVLWGDQDPFTPLDGPVGKYFSSLPSQSSNLSLLVLEGVGHCPHDDKPDLVHEKLLPWLAQLTAL